MKRKFEKVLALFIALAICVSTTDMNAFAAEKSRTENVEEATAAGDAVSSGDSISEKEVPDNRDGVTTESVYETESCRVIFSLTGR